MDALLASLRAAGEPTRLRLLALAAHGELSVTEFTQILGQTSGEAAHFARTLVDLLPQDDNALNRDLQRLEQIRVRRRDLADAYFNQNAAEWNRIRQLHVPEADVEARLIDVIGKKPITSFVDIGTGTGRILALLAKQVENGIGIDQNAEMLAVARANLEQEKLTNVHVRKGDMYNMPFDDQSVDLATVHLVLHYSHDPVPVIAEAVRVLKPSGRLVIVDFAPHQEEHLRTEHNHMRLGFSDREIRAAMKAAGLSCGKTHSLAGDPLTVNIWHGSKAAVH